MRFHARWLILLLIPATMHASGGVRLAAEGDPFLAFIRETVSQIPPARSLAYTGPGTRELDDWSAALDHFRAGRLDDCRAVLAGLRYSLTTVSDPVTGNTYDIIRENAPIVRGWGTLIHNRDASRRINVHVNHPIEDENVTVVAAELFRHADARWLLLAGSAKTADRRGRGSDPAMSSATAFQRWHELLGGPTVVSLSLHGFLPDRYDEPISSADVVLSNGRTSDLQWGISRLSLAFRDSLRAAGFNAALAMLDSGFARLAAGSNPQGVHSNDRSGFGRWINVELAPGLRRAPREYARFIGAASRALGVAAHPALRQNDEAFGLVSPRIIRLDRRRGLRFPPAAPSERYRIVSFSAGKSRNDTLDLLFGDWFSGNGRRGNGARIVEYDTTGSITSFHPGGSGGSGTTVTKIVTAPAPKYSSGIRPVEHRPADSTGGVQRDARDLEPIQVHRIPLRPVLASTVTHDPEPAGMPFHWGGPIHEEFTPRMFTFHAGDPALDEIGLPGLSRFLIPLLRNSYRPGARRYVGVEMTDLLVNEIARLVSEYRVEGSEIGVMAEESESGDYYLRLFPEPASDHVSRNLP